MKTTKTTCDFCGIDITGKKYSTIDYKTQESGIQSLKTRIQMHSNDVCLECIDSFDNVINRVIAGLRKGLDVRIE